MLVRREAAHVRADLSQDVLRRQRAHSRHGHQPLDLLLKRANEFRDPLLEGGDLLVQVRQVVHQLAQHEPMVLGQVPTQSLAQGRQLVA